MKHVVWLVFAVAGLCTLGCQGSHHHTGTEPDTSPTISNLKTLTFVRIDPNTGELGLRFDYADPDGDVSQVLVTFTDGTAANPAEGVTGRTSGMINILQPVRLPDPSVKEISFTVQVVDAAGNRSNTLPGQVSLP